MGLVVWTLIRFEQIEHWSPGIRFFGNEMIDTKGIAKSAVSNLQEGTSFHLIRVRRDGGIAARHIAAGSPAEKAGMLSGDLITSINGVDLKTNPQAYFQVRLLSSPGDTFDLVWQRNGEMHSGSLALVETDHLQYAIEVDRNELAMGVGLMTWFQRGPFLVFPFVLLCFGTWMGFRSPHNSLAFKCALLFLAMALSTTSAFHPMIAGWPHWVLTTSIVVIVGASLLKTILIFGILSVFPVETSFGKWLREHAWFIVLPLSASYVMSLAYFLSLTHGWDNELVRFVVGVIEPIPDSTEPILIVLFAGALLFCQRSAARRQQRMRLQLIVFGFALALVLAPLWIIALPGTLMAARGLLPIEGAKLPVLIWLIDRMVYVALKCALPMAFAYAIVAYRIFGLRIVIGRSLRYLVGTQGVYVIFCAGLVALLYQTASAWQDGIVVSKLLLHFTIAGVIVVLIGGWTWIKDPVVRFLDRLFYRKEIENRERLIGFVRTMPYYRDRDALISNTGKELLEDLELSHAAIYLKSGPNDTLTAAWHGVGDGVDQHVAVDAEYCPSATAGMDELLESEHAHHPFIEFGSHVHRDEPEKFGLKKQGFDLVVLLRSKTGHQGLIALGSRLSEQPFGSEEKEQLLVLATEFELALENIEMAASLIQQADGLKRLSRRLIDVQESEKSRLARDLHDDAGQSLTALKINLEQTRNALAGDSGSAEATLDSAIALTDETVTKLRGVSHGQRPPALETAGLDAALDGLCKNYSRQTGIPITYSGMDTRTCSSAAGICLYRILQEGLSNCVKHSEANGIEIKLEQDSRQILLTILDDGKGFDPEEKRTSPAEQGTGLIGMRERAETLDGCLEIQSAQGVGTRLVARIPNGV